MPNAIPNRPADKRRLLDKAGLHALLSEPLPERGKTRTVFDSEVPSFAVRISPQGVATFCMVYSHGGSIKRYSIGRFRAEAKRATDRGITAADARRKATVLRAQIEEGQDIAASRAASKARARDAHSARLALADERRRKSSFTFGALMDAYVEHLRSASKPSATTVERSVERNIGLPYPKLSALPADEVTVEAVMPVFHRLAADGKFREAEKLRAYVRAAYTAARKARTDAAMHAFAGFQIRFNPLEELAVTRPKEAAQRAADAAKDRKWALSEAQLSAYWHRICALDAPHGSLLRLHLLSGGQRAEQLSRLTTTDYDADSKTLRLYDTKGRRRVAFEHVVPLLPEAEHALKEMRRITKDKHGNDQQPGPYLFTVSNGKEGAVYHTLRDGVLEVAKAMKKAKEVDRLFTPGIIRKTVETRLAAMGVSKEVRARLQSHGIGGVQDKHYDAHDYDQEKRNALRRLRQLCEGKTRETVVPMRRKA